MSAADLLEDGFPHGTVDGFQGGCRSGFCPAGNEHGLSCRRAKHLTAGDYRFQRLVKRGLTPSEIALELGLAPETHTPPKRAKRAVLGDGDDEEVAVEATDDTEGEEVVEQTVVVPTPKDVAPKKQEQVPGDRSVKVARMRMWAKEHGISIANRGRVPAAVEAGFDADDPTLGGTRKPKPKRAPRQPKPTVKAPTATEPVEHATQDAGALTSPTPVPAVIEAHTDDGTASQPTGDATTAVEGAHTPTEEEVAAFWEDPDDGHLVTEAGFALIVIDAIAEASDQTAELERTRAALALTLQKWGEERQKRTAAELRVAALRLQLTLERFGATVDATRSSLDAFSALHGAHVAARKPWWKRWVA